MKRALYAVPIFMAILPLAAQAPAVGNVWKADDLKAKGAALTAKLDAHKLATQTLGSLGPGYTTLVAHREGSGEAEWHDNAADLTVIEDGECTLIMGGAIKDGHSTGAGETRGTSIEGGTEYRLGPGDVIYVPPKTPHQMVIAPGGKLTYWLVKIPAPKP